MTVCHLYKHSLFCLFLNIRIYKYYFFRGIATMSRLRHSTVEKWFNVVLDSVLFRSSPLHVIRLIIILLPRAGEHFYFICFDHNIAGMNGSKLSFTESRLHISSIVYKSAGYIYWSAMSSTNPRCSLQIRCVI